MEMIKSHIEKEEMIIYPLCMEKLSEEDWKECEEKAKAKE
jgi:hemerythrin-like domain-containing protein